MRTESARRGNAGFTMIELVMVIVLTGIVASITAVFIVEPMRAYVDQSRRAALVDQADIALRRMGREIRAAVPNSVRVSNGGLTLTLYNVVSGARYRNRPPPGNPAQLLEFDRADASFEVLGGFPGVPALTSSTHQLVIYNLGTPGSDLYEGSAVATPVISPLGNAITIAGSQVTLAAPFRFGWESPEQRVFLTDGPASYTCNGGTLSRNGVTVADSVTGCGFSYLPGSETRSGLATLNLSLARGGESVTLLRQVHVENLP